MRERAFKGQLIKKGIICSVITYQQMYKKDKENDGKRNKGRKTHWPLQHTERQQ
jgi:hypothetical protein